jgi:hypothetical protein
MIRLPFLLSSRKDGDDQLTALPAKDTVPKRNFSFLDVILSATENEPPYFFPALAR